MARRGGNIDIFSKISIHIDTFFYRYFPSLVQRTAALRVGVQSWEMGSVPQWSDRARKKTEK